MAYDGLMNDMRTIIDGGTPGRVPTYGLSEEFDVKWYNKGTYNEVILDADTLAGYSPRRFSAGLELYGFGAAFRRAV